MAIDFSSVLKREVMRPLAVTFIPATVAVSSVAYFQINAHPGLVGLYTKHLVEVNTTLVVILFIAGMIIENLGSWLENHLYRKIRNGQSDDAWEKYLKSEKDKFPVATSYMRSILDRMKFELSMAVAVPIQLVSGLTAAYFTDQMGVNFPAGFWVVGSVLLSVLFWIEAKGSVSVLDELRTKIFT